VDLDHGVIDGHLALPRRGRVPFGQRKYGQDRQVNEIELVFDEGCSAAGGRGLVLGADRAADEPGGQTE